MLINPSQNEEPNRYIVLQDDIQDTQPYYITLPEPPKTELITNYKLAPEQQFFKRLFIPPSVRRLSKMTREEQRRAVAKDNDVRRFIDLCWRKRNEGEWQYINGKAYYLTGTYWFFLNFYDLGNGLPDFRLEQCKYFSFRKFIVWDDPAVWGSNTFTTRQVGKSTIAGAEHFEMATRIARSNFGIISKDEKGAVEFFLKYITKPRRKLVWFFQPIFDGNLMPKKELNFMLPSMKSASIADFDVEEEALDTKIDIRALTLQGYDSETVKSVIVDEGGKFEDVSVVQLWDRLKYSLRAVNGKANFITTIEELSRNGGQEFKTHWDNSNRDKTNELGETVTGLVNYFIPTQNVLVHDQFGLPVINDPTPLQQKYLYETYKKKGYKEEVALRLSRMGALEKIKTEKEGIKDSWERTAYIRKHPTTIREGFASSFVNCHFNLDKINTQIERIMYDSPYIVRRGNFEWENNVEDSRVIFREDSAGRWLVSYLMPQEQSNKFKVVQMNQRAPIPSNNFTGVDPYRYAKSIDPKGSFGAIATWTNKDDSIDANKPEDMWLTEDYTVIYLYRPNSKYDFFEDCIKQCVYTNSTAFIESNATDDIFEHFYERGYGGYLKYDMAVKKKKNKIKIEEKATPGVYNAGNQSLKNRMFTEAEYYINYCSMRAKFEIVLTQHKDVQFEDLQPYDMFVACNLARINANMVAKRPLIPLVAAQKERPIVRRQTIQIR